MRSRFAFALAASILLTTIVTAQEKQGTFENNPLSGSNAFKTLALSGRLLAYGRKNRDALALIVAASMRKKLALRPVERTTEEEGGEGETKDTSLSFEIKAIIAEAQKYAAGDESLIGLGEDVLAISTKGKSDGPAYNIKTIRARGKNHYDNIRFDGGQYAEIYVEGSGRANLDLFVYNQAGTIVCSDTDASDINYCGWTPTATSGYRVTVINKGNRSNRYSLMTN